MQRNQKNQKIKCNDVGAITRKGMVPTTCHQGDTDVTITVTENWYMPPEGAP